MTDEEILSEVRKESLVQPEDISDEEDKPVPIVSFGEASKGLADIQRYPRSREDVPTWRCRRGHRVY